MLIALIYFLAPVDNEESCLGPFSETVSAGNKVRERERERVTERESERERREGAGNNKKKNSAERIYDSPAHYRNPVSIHGENRFKTPY